jgi:hypothetical protein
MYQTHLEDFRSRTGPKTQGHFTLGCVQWVSVLRPNMSPAPRSTRSLTTS